jgi:hypothetical protein
VGNSQPSWMGREQGLKGMGSILLPLGIGLILGACGGPSSESLEEPEIRLTVSALINEERAGEGGFGRIADLEIAEDGHVYVLDELNRTVQVFDENGFPVRTFGGRGQGPGELEWPSSLAWGPDGDLWVADPGNGRFSVFDREGNLVDGHPSPDAFFHPMAVGFSGEGHLLSVGQIYEGGSLEDPTTVLVETEVTPGQIREVGRAELPFIEQPAAFQVRSEGMVFFAQIPFSSEPMFHFDSRGRLWYSGTGEPWVHRWSPTGEVEQTVGRELPAPRVTQAERQALLEDEEYEELRVEGGPQIFAEFASLIPDTKPPIQGFFLDDEDRVWIIRTESPPRETRPMDVYLPDGTLLGVARTALEPEPRPRMRRGLLVGVIRDGMGREAVAIYRINP